MKIFSLLSLPAHLRCDRSQLNWSAETHAQKPAQVFIDGRKPIRATFDFIDTDLHKARLHPGVFNAVYQLPTPRSASWFGVAL